MEPQASISGHIRRGRDQSPSLYHGRTQQEGSHLQARKWVLTRDLDVGLPASITVGINVYSVGHLVDGIL